MSSWKKLFHLFFFCLFCIETHAWICYYFRFDSTLETEWIVFLWWRKQRKVLYTQMQSLKNDEKRLRNDNSEWFGKQR